MKNLRSGDRAIGDLDARIEIAAAFILGHSRGLRAHLAVEIGHIALEEGNGTWSCDNRLHLAHAILTEGFRN